LSSLGITKGLSLAEYNVEITVRATGAAASTVSNTATITSAGLDSHPGNNQSTAVTRITK
jgi:hypothetical protein